MLEGCIRSVKEKQLTKPAPIQHRTWRKFWLTVLIALGLLVHRYFSPGNSQDVSAPQGNAVTIPLPKPGEAKSVPSQPSRESQRSAPDSEGESLSADDSQVVLEVADVNIHDLDGRLVYSGNVDLSGTMERIRRGSKLRFANDGSVFENREGRLPRQKRGHYREFVHPTPGLSGPGPQRIVTGQSGEVYYTPDHYRTFEKLSP